MALSSAQRILICFHDFPFGGTERIAIGLAKHWVEAGRDVTILCGTEAGVQRPTVDPRVKVIAVDPPITRSTFSRPKLGRKMGKMLGGLAPDIIFLPGNFHMLLANYLHVAAPKIPIVLKISNPPLLDFSASAVERFSFRYLALGLDALAPMNKGLERQLRELLPKKNITTLYDPIYTTPHLFPRTRRADGRFHILWAGRLEPQKDVPLALNTLLAVLKRTPAHLTMLGDGKLMAQTVNQIKMSGLADNVTLTGHAPSIDPFFDDADALLVTSHFEGGPAVAAEALAHGVPVVSTDCSHFLHDIMIIPEAGQIVRSRDADDLAAALLAIDRQAPRAPEQLQGLVAHLDPARCAQAYLEWLDTVVAERGRR